MNIKCPNCKCQAYQKCGSFYRKNDSRYIQKYRCKKCKKYFSRTTFSDCYRQKKRRVNDLIFKLLCSSSSMRRTAIIAKVDRKTVSRKLRFLGLRARKNNLVSLKKMKPVKHLQFDDLITKEHTKLKPLSITVAVDANSRKILAAKVSQIPAFGHLSKISREKYGRRKSYHRQALISLFEETKNSIDPNALIRSDEHKFYPEIVQKYLPNATHQRFKGGRAAIVGQGELKKLSRDPLFYINHTCAMLRDNIRRLVRKSWCLSKCPEMLQLHLDLYINFHNNILIK